MKYLKVNPKECMIVFEGEEYEAGLIRQADQIILEPRYDGNYTVPKKPWEDSL